MPVGRHTCALQPRHSLGLDLSDRGIEDSAIQPQLGHTDLDMIRESYTGIRLAKMGT